MKYEIRKLLKNGDIIPNISATYPINALAAKSEKEFFYPEDCEITESYLMRVNNIEINFEPTTRKKEFEYD